jgi:hypothetical protein
MSTHSKLLESIENHPDHQAAVAFMQTVEGKEGVDYQWVFDHAKLLWEDRQKTLSDLDAKADGIIRYLGGGTALFTLGVLARVDASVTYLVWWSLPAVACALISIVLALLARKPQFFPSLPPVENAKEYAEKESAPLPAILGQWHLACVDATIACEKKAFYVEWATRFYFLSIASLALPIIVAASFPPIRPAQVK